MKDDQEWWEPVPISQDWIDEIRRDYDEPHLSDEEVVEEYNPLSEKFSLTWDNLGDAAEAYEHLATAYLDLKTQLHSISDA